MAKYEKMALTSAYPMRRAASWFLAVCRVFGQMFFAAGGEAPGVGILIAVRARARKGRVLQSWLTRGAVAAPFGWVWIAVSFQSPPRYPPLSWPSGALS